MQVLLVVNKQGQNVMFHQSEDFMSSSKISALLPSNGGGDLKHDQAAREVEVNSCNLR